MTLKPPDWPCADIVQAEGRLDAVVVNAGNGIYGPLKERWRKEARSQFETNYFGTFKTIQACCRCSASSILAALSP